MIRNRLRFTLNTLREKLWIKPVGYAILAVVSILVARAADYLPFEDAVPEISSDTNEKLLSIIAASMLGVATFAVTSMVSAYASASQTATPRAFVLVVSDGLSQTALSAFVGAFIYAIVGIIGIRIEYFGSVGQFAIFCFTILVIGFVILTFVRWVDSIARMGRMENTISRVEDATSEALGHWHPAAPLWANPWDGTEPANGHDMAPGHSLYIQHIDMDRLQAWAEENEAHLYVRARPGAFVTQRRALLTIVPASAGQDTDLEELHEAFVLGPRRSYSTDPRRGFLSLSEIGCRALSPAVNDPGTGIDVIATAARLIRNWARRHREEDAPTPHYDRLHVPPLNPADLLDDAFGAVIKDGVGSVEVCIWAQRMLGMLVREADEGVPGPARAMAEQALARAEQALDFGPDVERVREAHKRALG